MPPALQTPSAAAPPAAARDHFFVGPAPPWAEFRPIPRLGTVSNDPIAMPLVDRQVKLAESATFTRTVKQLNNGQGVLHGSRVEINFNPSLETVTVHSIGVIRGGQRSERCRPAAFRLLQREANLEQHVVDGQLTAMLFLEDVRVGDLVDVSYTVSEVRTAFPGRFSTGQYVQFPVEVGVVSLTVRGGENTELRSKCGDPRLECQVSELPGERVYRWVVEGPERIRVPAGMPSWCSPGEVLWVSDFASWGEVAVMTGHSWSSTWAPSEDEGELNRLVDGFRSGAHSMEDVADRIVRFVQNEIRYLSLEEGIGCFVPQHPVRVLERRFGDCKDKSVLLSCLLNRAGIPARPVLVSAGSQHALRDLLPSARAFDHVIVVFFVGTERFFVDPTIQDQGGDLRTRTLPQFGFGLVVDRHTTDLIELPRLRSDAGEMFIHEEFSIHGETEPVDLTVTTMAKGLDADFLRQQLETVNREHLEREIESRYRQLYRSLTPESGVEFHDDPIRNVLRIVHHFSIDQLSPTVSNSGRKVFHFPVHAIEGRFLGCNDHDRVMPLAIAFPNKVTQRISATFPRPVSIRQIEDLQIEDPSFRFGVNTRSNGRLAEATFFYESLRDHVPADTLPGYMERLNEAFEMLGFNVPATSGGRFGLSVLRASLALAGAIMLIGLALPELRGGNDVEVPVAVRVDRSLFPGEDFAVDAGTPADPPEKKTTPGWKDEERLGSASRARVSEIAPIGYEAGTIAVQAGFLPPGQHAESPRLREATEISRSY